MKKEWPVKRLGEVCEIIMGQSPDGESYNTTGEGVPLINGPVEFSAESFGKTVRTKFTTQPTKFCKEGDLILCVRGSTTGRMNIAGFDACVGRGVAAIRAKQYQPWINHFISSKRDEIHGKGTGATFPNVSGDSLANFELVFPPLPEQQRIVALLDEAFAGLATAKANAERNLENARAIFDSHLESVFSRRGEGWEECTLEDLTEPDSPITYGVVKPGPEGEIRFVRGGDLVSGKVRLTQLRTITREVSDQYKRTLLRGGELLICLVGQPGQVGIAPAELAGANIARQVGLIRLSARINAEFVRFFLQSAPGAEALGARESGSVQQVINLGELRQVAIPYPAFSEQVDIIARLNLVDAETQRLTHIYERKLAALEELKGTSNNEQFAGSLRTRKSRRRGGRAGESYLDH